jgi:hypothetical protein
MAPLSFSPWLSKRPTTWGPADRDCLIQVLMDGHRAPRQGIPESRLIDLPEPAADRDGVVFGHDPLGLYREDPVQVAPTDARNAVPFSSAATLNFALNSPM